MQKKKKKERKKKVAVLVAGWGFDKTFMITRVLEDGHRNPLFSSWRAVKAIL